PSPSSPAADPAAIADAARWLIEAENPVILTAYAGRNPSAVGALVRLAELLAVPVIETRHRLNFPSSHPLHLGYSGVRALPHADCVLMVDHDVPWIPAQSAPGPEAKIIQIDNDPVKRDMPLWGFEVDLSIQADSSLALDALALEVARQLGPLDRDRIEQRRHRVSAEHQSRAKKFQQRSLDVRSMRPIAPEYAASCLNEIVDDETIIVSEAVTNGPVLWNYLQLDKPGSFFQSQGSGLGWGLGAALGAKLASPSKTIVCVVGDGSWIFGNPLVAYWTALEQNAPFLTVIFNNQQYCATVEAIQSAAPHGAAIASYPACETPKAPLYSKVSEALGLWAKTVNDPAELPSALRDALQAVRGGRPAVVDICVSTGPPVPSA
ncbi:MAG: acetolactate synthase, partial [Acidobacteriia bacterium]|nr:acetolactate synthase [Terriglobia bacterium]